MNLFLRGVPGVGKSTIIKRALADFKICSGGFITLGEEVGENGCSNVYIHPANGLSREYGIHNLIGERLGYGKFRAHPETFETYGLELLRNISCPLILMDEIGFMENEALKYQDRILEILGMGCLILGVVKAVETPFIKKIVEHPDSWVVDVDRDNREDVYLQAKFIVEKYLPKK